MRSRIVVVALTMAIAVYAGPNVKASNGGDNQVVQLKEAVDDLSSDNGDRRVAASKLIFNKGRAALGSLRSAGAEQVAPRGTLSTSRLDMVYSLIDGFGENPVDRRSGYKTDSFGLYLEKTTTKKDVTGLLQTFRSTLIG